MGLTFGILIALLLLILPGAIVARSTQLTWPITAAVAPALTYGVVALAIIPFGALGIPWNGWTALAALVAVCLVMTGLQLLLARYRDPEAEARGIGGWPALALPCGPAEDGLPASLQVVAPPGADARVLAAGAQLASLL